MIKVLFFAKLREDLQLSELSVNYHSGLHTIQHLVDSIAKEQGAAFAEHLANPQIITAQNHETVGRDVILHDGDEIAFFPPVTGG